MIDNRENFALLTRLDGVHPDYMRIPVEAYATTKGSLWTKLNGHRGRILSVSRECCFEYLWLIEFADDSASPFRVMLRRSGELEFEQNWVELFQAANKAYWERVDAELAARGHNVDALFGF